MTTTSYTTPILQSASAPVVTADGFTVIDLVFDTAMAAGSGTIYVTDGLAQTAIDRATGKLGMRVVGATDTHAISASSVSITGNQVTLKVAGLLPQHGYSIVMGSGVLVSDSKVPFGGVRHASQLQFTSAPAGDHEGPAVASITLDGGTVTQTGTVGVRIVFSEKVDLGAGAISAPNASLGNLASSDGGLTWTATLRAGGAVDADANKLAIDLAKVHDLTGNAGSGSVLSTQSYAVHTALLSAAIHLDGALLQNGGAIGVTITLSDSVGLDDLRHALDAEHADLGTLFTSDGGRTWRTVLTPNGGTVDDSNVLTLDLGKLHDSHGNVGSGSVSSANYAVDYAVDAYVAHDIAIKDDRGPYDDDHVSNVANQTFRGMLSESLGSHERVMLSIDGGAEFAAAVDGLVWYGGGTGLHMEDGLHTITARVIDDDHHASALFSQRFEIDTVGPMLLTSPNGKSGSAGEAMVFSFDQAVYPIEGEGYSTITIQDIDGTLRRVDVYPSNLSADRKTLSIPASQHGMASGHDYTITLHNDITDLAGNPIRNLAPMRFHVDGSGPDTLAPSALSATSHEGMFGIGQAITVDVSFSEAVKQAGSGTPALVFNNGGVALWDSVSADGRTVSFKYVVGNNPLEGTPDNKPAFDFSDAKLLAGHVSDLAGNLLDGAHILFDKLTIVPDGGHAVGKILIDAEAGPAPSRPMLDAGSDSGVPGDAMTNVRTPGLSGDGAASFATVQLFDETGRLLAKTVATAGNHWSIGAGDWLPGTSLADGPHSLSVKQVDGFGNVSGASPLLSLTIDASILPATVTLADATDHSLPDGDLVTSLKRPTFMGHGEVGALVSVYDGGTKIGETRIDNGGIYEITAGADMAEGVHSLSVEQTDLAGNTSPRSASTPVSFRIDPSPGPGASSLSLAAASDTGIFNDDRITRDNTPTLTGTASQAGGSIEVYEGSKLLGTTAVAADKSWSFTAGQLADGSHQLTVQQVDAAGHRGAASSILNLTVDTAAPAVLNSKVSWANFKNWLELEFNEKIVFTNGSLAVLDDTNATRSQLTWDVKTNWTIENNAADLQSVLELNLGSLSGWFHLWAGDTAIQDVAGNAAIIGIPSFNVPGAPV